jgi:hypothetical protein
MQKVAVVFGECNAKLLASYSFSGEKVERWNGEMVERFPETSPSSYIICHHGLSGHLPKREAVCWGDLTRDPVL